MALHRPAPMAFLNDNYLKLKAGYLFPEIARRVKAFGDVSQLLPAALSAVAVIGRVLLSRGSC
jgi:hypothetical protein